MYDYIKVGDLVYVKRKIKIAKEEDTCLVLSKEKLDNDFLFNLLYKNKIKIYNTTLLNRNITLELVENV